ncbi:MAG: ATP/GTP-binding protein [Actinobacteria bacterium]|nr:ATP/GTP-binding protein [Actinomycetota bacterium]
MSPRRTRRERSGPPDPGPGLERVESWPDGDWTVRPVPGAGSAKAYRCPGCDQEILPGTPHVVAWPADGLPGGGAGVQDRRHWHTSCWQHRLRRGPGVRRRGNP